ncbi:ATP-dependent DNA helicase PIF1-like [Papaver somniferum]|uniref:ATP-dependent DNA helicase PIF1-like n=1 Tax=Papaver somniferum TaxID=3469 RepID=UPI000E6F8157|nr:ATP-dependent DNA helicase PIF1-like [Papaver somniferum]
MVEDYSSSSNTSSTFLSDRLLRELNLILKQHDKDISMYDLPPIVGILGEDFEILSLIQEELSILISDEELSSVQKLNEDQSRAYDTIMGEIERKESKVFFIDGTGGTGKTYLYRAILATFRKNGGIALATATSGITTTMLPGGRTSHSRFQLPTTPTSILTCHTKKQTDEAKLLRHATVLMWDEDTMAHHYSLEAFDRTMRDITGIAEPFCGNILIMGGDFRQRIIRNDIELHYTLNKSHLWENVHVLHLKKNMRAAKDASYSEFLIRVGDEDEPCVANEMIKVPEEMVTMENARDRDYMVNRAWITPLNEYVENLNDRVLIIFPGKEVIFYSFDSMDDDTHGLYQQEYLNNIAPRGISITRCAYYVVA